MVFTSIKAKRKAILETLGCKRHSVLIHDSQAKMMVLVLWSGAILMKHTGPAGKKNKASSVWGCVLGEGLEKMANITSTQTYIFARSFQRNGLLHHHTLSSGPISYVFSYILSYAAFFRLYLSLTLIFTWLFSKFSVFFFEEHWISMEWPGRWRGTRFIAEYHSAVLFTSLKKKLKLFFDNLLSKSYLTDCLAICYLKILLYSNSKKCVVQKMCYWNPSKPVHWTACI